MRRKLFSISAECLGEFFRGPQIGRLVTQEGFPADGRIVGSAWDSMNSTLMLTVESETFEAVLDGHLLPDLTVTLHTSVQDEARP